MQPIIDKHFQCWSMFHNYTTRNGRIWFIWNGQMQVDLVDSTDQSITCCITYDSHKFFLNAIYGCNDGMDRKRLWSYLYSLHSSLSQDPCCGF